MHADSKSRKKGLEEYFVDEMCNTAEDPKSVLSWQRVVL
jgi:hypothetical protein